MALLMEISPNEKEGLKLQDCSTHLSPADLPAKLTYPRYWNFTKF